MDYDNYGLLFSTPRKIEFLDQKFDFEISPDHFIKWLKEEGEEVTGDYKIDVGTMCEYSCLYIAMLLSDRQLDGDMKVYYGKFGFWEHFWIGYKYKNQEYYIDLTLQQFISDAPKLAITKAHNERVSGSYSYLSEGELIKDYLERQNAFLYHVNPKTMEKSVYSRKTMEDISSSFLSISKLESFEFIKL